MYKKGVLHLSTIKSRSQSAPAGFRQQKKINNNTTATFLLSLYHSFNYNCSYTTMPATSSTSNLTREERLKQREKAKETALQQQQENQKKKTATTTTTTATTSTHSKATVIQKPVSKKANTTKKSGPSKATVIQKARSKNAKVTKKAPPTKKKINKKVPKQQTGKLRQLSYIDNATSICSNYATSICSNYATTSSYTFIL
jgi:hypothetical protein